MVHIYTLSDENGIIRYIGKAKNLDNRLKRHIQESIRLRCMSHKEYWIREILSRGSVPIIESLEYVINIYWIQREIYWISQFKTWGFKLVNLTDGGEGGNGFSGKKHTEEAKAKMKANTKAGSRAKSGSENYNSSLTMEDAISIRKKRKTGVTVKELTVKYEVGKSTIIRILNNETYKNS